MIPKMHVIPWDPKALKNEVTHIVRRFSEKEGSVNSVKAEQMIPTMNVTLWERKTLRQEVIRIVRSFSRQESSTLINHKSALKEL
jgi:hypothetical protein